MNRINIILMIFYCCLLFAAGVVFGFLFTSDGQINFVTFLGAISSLATVAAAMTAVYALRAWHAQFKHSEKYKAVLRFRESLDRGDSAVAFIRAVFQYVEEQNMRTQHASLVDLLAMRNAASQLWIKHSFKVEQAWNDLERLMSAAEIRQFPYSPVQLEEYVRDFVEHLDYVTSDGASVNILELSNDVQSFCSKTRDRNIAFVDSANFVLKDLMS